MLFYLFRRAWLEPTKTVTVQLYVRILDELTVRYETALEAGAINNLGNCWTQLVFLITFFFITVIMNPDVDCSYI